MAETITEFLVSRGENPEEFAPVIKRFEDRMRDVSGRNYQKADIRDIKRFGEMIAVLLERRYLSGFPGIRCECQVLVFTSGKTYLGFNTHIDGLYGTRGQDRLEEDYWEILGCSHVGDHISVRLKGRKEHEGTIECR
ncbi:MAG: hypothetical protein COV07_03555 [Candidatus Vogelbacteria bacterium CG10_big_fil_rev_8_21_14_0_10_45_14]|uniref:Uncharacterized protein n=1 Tax=Candidatus Vogelbacteria bacterium CG10_big_fil_rev_8_21_14_0_10_45_14 TaxID=1975042 RepID=A0A2H0RJF8_9BACT|nr:MAG: hypothetical protein COV07_03555 [Candidatus Vogelbacteria bacterium CG10_big_fil_rev_8_21_14_0_10_45_14]